MRKRIVLIFYLLVAAIQATAQTGGPGQPEFMEFKPVTASDLVNLSNGAFSYNIPLFEIGGYPVNLSYQSGPQMDDVASTVGLGWNLNIGAITHTMRGLPDDFKGDTITRIIHNRPNITMGANMDLGIEIAGFPIGFDTGTGIFYNNYNGFGLEQSFGVSFSVSNSSATAGASLGLGMKANSQSGVDVYAAPAVSLSSAKSSSMAASGSLGGVISVNSREGLKTSINASMSLSTNLNNSPIQTGKSISASYSFSKSPEIPRVTYPYDTKAYTGSFKLGAEIYFVHPNTTLTGYYTKQQLSVDSIRTPAYGYLYSDQAGETATNVLLDFNREKDQPFVKDASKNIGIPFYTNDIYSVNAQGISGSFQLNRGDIGVIFDTKVTSSSTALNIGLEAGPGDLVHVGADVSSTSNTSSSGKWQTNITHSLEFRPQFVNDLYQPAYFKNAADINVDANDFYAKLNFDKPVKVALQSAGATAVNMTNILVDPDISQVNIPSQLYKPARDPRTINIQYLTAAEASKFGLDKVIYQYGVNQFDCNNANYKKIVQRTAGYRQLHHISEITATNTDGMRYVFGLPTYNTNQQEVSYTLSGGEAVDADGQVKYAVPTGGWGTNGKDGFYEKTTTPAYVTSNLLTAVLSPDYIDVDNNGPSMNDVGNYVKFNYTYAGLFTWRTPYSKDSATFNKAFLSDPTDNKASYVVGTKELWYIHSIESKTEVAEFYYDTTRMDGRGAVDHKRLYRLTEIRVFSKNERVLNGANAVAIRIIKFTQNYALCPGTKNSSAPNGGKLTLNEVGMYSGKSMRELRSPYKFTYGEMPSGFVVNPPYNAGNVNRWGNYQKNTTPDIIQSDINTGLGGTLSNGDFPYSSQNVADMNQSAYAWNLTKIQLPGGGTIRAVYEPHHYAYTQDQRNMEMFQIDGFGNSVQAVTNNPSADLYNGSTSNYFARIRLKKALPPGSASDKYNQLLYQYFNTTSAAGLNQYIYYKTLIHLRPETASTWEWVSGYCKVASVGVIDALHAYIELVPVCINDKTGNSCPGFINPIAKNAFQFMRMNRAGLCYGQTESQPLPDNATLEDFLETHDLVNKVADQIIAFTQGFNNYARATPRSFARSVAQDKSFVRLYSPYQDKIIGGSRVKTIITDDNWNQLTTGYGAPHPASKSYTIDYDYTDVVKNPVTNADQVISSGVTEYEPIVGGDENPLHQPSFYDEQIKLAPDNNLYVDLPYNESLYPAPNIVYSKVKVTSNKTNLSVPGTGYQVHEFFTAKDYPVRTGNTEIGDNFEKKTSLLQGLISSTLGVGEFYDYMTVSQGFSIVRNDMHGKTKSTKNFNSQGSIVSGEEYEYVVNKPLKLIDRSGTVYDSDRLGVSVSAICDARNTEHNTDVVGVDLNLDFTVLAIVPAVLAVPLPTATTENTRMNTVAFNKIIDEKGIEIRKTITENGASVSTDNLVFDDRTGTPVLTRTTNEFNDFLYSFHYPAHWIYNGLSAGYLASDLQLNVATNTVPVGSPEILSALNEGDELADANGNRLWITAKSSNSITAGPRIPGSVLTPGTYKVLRPGKRNMLNEEAGTVVTNYYPVVGNKISFSANPDSTGIINANMKQYADNRVKYCNCDQKGPAWQPANIAYNPYSTGELGNWYPLKTWAYLTGRTRSLNMPNHLTNLRKDGIFKDYSSFFNTPADIYGDWTIIPGGWQWVETVTIKDVNGLTVETKDPLNRYNAMLTGYKQKLIVAEAGNAKQREIMFDSFEDWNYLPYSSICDSAYLCQPEQINWHGIFKLVSSQAHTGKFSGQLIIPNLQVQVPLDIINSCGPANLAANRRDSIETVCCTGIFRPTKGKKYVISAWVRETGNDLAYIFTAPSIMVNSTTFNTSGNIIDGWQRIYGEFVIPANATSLDLVFSKGANDTYFDDIRIYPADGKMTTYVYDRNTQKLTFTSDENNYFTKYNYDGENNLQSINKETEQGVLTTKEARSSTYKAP